MSKQSEAKTAQGYTPKALPRTCVTCRHFQSETVESYEYLGKTYYKDVNLRCGIGGFAVKKTGTCDLWSNSVD